MILVGQMILQDHMTKGQSNIMGRVPTKLVTILPSLHCGSEDIIVLVCHVILT